MLFPVDARVVAHNSRDLQLERAPFFTSIALPLTVALAMIRLLVYGMRELSAPGVASRYRARGRIHHLGIGALFHRRAARV
jgi:hypothetical protein